MGDEDKRDRKDINMKNAEKENDRYHEICKISSNVLLDDRDTIPI